MAKKRKGYKHGDFIKGDPNPHVDTYKYKDRQTGKITSHKVEGSEMKSSQKKQQARQGQLAGRKSKPKIIFYLKDPEKSKPKLIIKDPKPKQEPKYPRNGKQREGGLDSSDITENLQQGKPDPILPPKEKGIRKALRGGGRAYGKNS